MALGQTLLLAKNIPFCSPKCPLTNTHVPNWSPKTLSSLRLISFPARRRRLGFNCPIRCSMGFNNSINSTNNGHYDQIVGPQYPRPSEIQWKKELCNSVQLIGIVGTPVQIKNLSSGKVLAWSRLAVKKSSSDTVWINLTFWDELAHVAFQHVEKGNQIYVSGRLVSDTVENDEGKEQTYYKVVVQQLNLVEKSFSSSVNLYDGESNSVTPVRKSGNYAANNAVSTEQLWQAFFANPVDWWDNRKNKRSPNYPDFKHKDTGEALWVEGRYNPPWVKSQLAILDSRMQSFVRHQTDSFNLNFMAGDNYTPF